MSVYDVYHFGTFVFSTQDQFLAVVHFEKLGKMQSHASSFIDTCIDPYIAKMDSFTR